MTRAKELLHAATPLPWEQGIVNPANIKQDSGRWTLVTPTVEDAALIVYAVNTLPAYEAAVEALDFIADWAADCADVPPDDDPFGFAQIEKRAREALRRLQEQTQ